jgi:Txe/YoeB family toxin of Txe-Axe toxin-antitoxin module
MVFITTLRIFEAYKRYRFFPMIVYGELGIGKSSFAIKLLAEVYGKWEDGTLVERNWDAWKEWMVFLPEEFIKRIDELQAKGERAPLLVWDDAGLWASSQKFKDKFAISLSDYFNVARTDLASVIFTTPDPSWLLKRIREIPGICYGRITYKDEDNGARHKELRYLIVYSTWKNVIEDKVGSRRLYSDMFDITLPNDVFKEYDKVRRKYAEVAKKKLEEVIEEFKYRTWKGYKKYKKYREKIEKEYEDILGEEKELREELMKIAEI